MQVDVNASLFNNFRQLVSSTKLRTFSILHGLIVLAMNKAVEHGFDMAVKHERLITYTSIIASGVLKLTLFYLINSFIIPIAVVTTLRNFNELWYEPRWFCSSSGAPVATRGLCCSG
jgi:hypothetical protein